MNVSLSRKIHIIALPHGTRNVDLSADQSVTMVCQAGSCAFSAPTISCAMASVFPLPLSRQQQGEQAEPDQQQPVPVSRAELHAQTNPAACGDRELVDRTPNAGRRPREHEQAADEMEAVRGREQNEERVSWIAGA